MRENREQLLRIIQRYLDNKATPEEQDFLKAYYSFFDKEQDIIDQLNIEEKKLLEEQLESGIWTVIRENEDKPIRSLWMKSVAAAILLISISIGAYILMRGDSQTVQVAQTEQNDALPGKNTAILTLANGKKIALDDTENGLIAQQEDAYIEKTSDGRVIYNSRSNETGSEPASTIAYNTIEVPRGGQFQLVLPDGTQVWLNSQSTLRYPTKFNTKKREVELTGEAYFEVAHNKNVPFLVNTRNQELTVLGTHFNVKAYADETSISTTLLEGKVKISNLNSGKTAVLSPGKQSITTSDGNIALATVNAEEAIAWKSGFFFFDNQDIKTVMTLISRWYNVDIVYRNIDNSLHLGGTFSKSSNLSELLKNLELVGNIHFKIEGRRVTVMK